MARTTRGLRKDDSTHPSAKAGPTAQSRKRKAVDEPVDSEKRKKASHGGSRQQLQALRADKQREAHAATNGHISVEPAAINSAPVAPLRLFVFGAGDGGELGLGPNGRNASKPRLNSLLEPYSSEFQIVQFSCGGMHTVALTSDNKIVTWGVNDNGALGRDASWAGVLRDAGDDSSDEDDEPLNPHESTPSAISQDCFPPGTQFVQVAAGDSCSFALTASGNVYGWGTFRDPEGNPHFGYDADGKLIEKQPSPLQLSSLTRITQIVCGANHALALDQHGTIWGWGSGHQNQLGRRLFGRNSDSLIPRRIELFRQKTKHIASGEYHALAVDIKDNVWGWGLNNFGQAGDAQSAGTDAALLPHPVKIRDLCSRGVISLDGGAHHSAAITAEGTCLTWGRFDTGQLGVSLTAEMRDDLTWIKYDERDKSRIILRPTRVEGIGKVAGVACGTGHTIFTGTNGLAYATGFGPMGQLGLGSEEEVNTAQQIKSKHIDGELLKLCGAGGQFSIVASLPAIHL